MKIKLKFIIFFTFLILIITGCSYITNNNSDRSVIYLFNRYMQRIEKYNLTTFRVESKLYDDINMFQYELPYRNKIFNTYNNRLLTSGHNVYNQFEIIKLTEQNVETILKNENKDNEALCPIDVYNDKIFFQTVLYKDQQPFQWGIASFDIDLTNRKDIIIKEAVNDVVIADNKIYYSTSISKNKSDILYYIDLNDQQKIKRRYDVNINLKKIFKYHDRLLLCDENYIYGVNDFLISYKYDSYFDDDSETLVQIYPQNGVLKCDLIDLCNNKRLSAFENAIDFQYIDDDNIKFYCEGKIYNVNISSLRRGLDNE